MRKLTWRSLLLRNQAVDLCPRCAERYAARARLLNLGWAALMFASAPAAVAVINALRRVR